MSSWLLGILDDQQGYTMVNAKVVDVNLNGALDTRLHRNLTPGLGEIFETLQLKEDVLDLEDVVKRDEILKDLARLISERGVVVFKRQDGFPPERLAELVDRWGQLAGKPQTSGIHIHPLNGDHFGENGAAKKGEKITTMRDADGRLLNFNDERSTLASAGWHTDVSFEKVPADYTILRMNVLPPSGGDTLYASAYEAYERLSPPIQKLLEGLTATHDAAKFRAQAQKYGFKLRTLPRGSPENVGDELTVSHPIIRIHPVTGWRALFVNPMFTVRINELTKDESDVLLKHLFAVIANNHDLQIRHTWSQNDIVVWDNRCALHSATFDIGENARSGDRAVSTGERPFFNPESRSRSEALALANGV